MSFEGGAFQDSRIYFISPVAKGALAYSNVNAEWLAEGRQNSMYVPEEPFTHSAVGCFKRFLALPPFDATTFPFSVSSEWEAEDIRKYLRIVLQGV